jgi:hypothetical protein
MSTRQERVAEWAMDNFDRLRGENLRVVLYALDQLVNGATPRYDPQRRPRNDSDRTMFEWIIRDRFRRVGIDVPR